MRGRDVGVVLSASRRMARAAVCCLMLLAATLALTSCSAEEPASRPPAPQSEGSGAADPHSEQRLTLDQIRDWSMPVARKQSDLASGFPIQVPVIEGTVTESDVVPVPDGVGEWLYVLETPHPYDEVTEWYTRTYPIANWEIGSIRVVQDGDPPATSVEMRKGDARSTVTIRGTEPLVTVEAVVGLGTSAGDTF